MGDLFHEDVLDGKIMDVWRIVGRCPQHTFMILTKRPKRMKIWLSQWIDADEDIEPQLARGPADVREKHRAGRSLLFANMIEGWGLPPDGAAYPTYDWMEGMRWWPNVLPNLWLGVTVEGSETMWRRDVADAPQRWLYRSAAASRCWQIDFTGIGWVIIGCESGPKRRPTEWAWVSSIMRQAIAAKVPVFLKQFDSGTGIEKMPEVNGREWKEFPEVNG
jgi:protein gp37